MAYELWSPTASATPVSLLSNNHEFGPLRQIENVMSPAPAFSAKTPTSAAKSVADVRELFKGLPAQERLKKIQEYQMKKNRAALTKLEGQNSQGQNPRRKSLRTSRESRTSISYHDITEGILGCKHYITNVSLSAPCCDTFYVCRFCHDERSDHAIDRKSVNRMKCLRCRHVQTFKNVRVFDEKCEACLEPFAKYFCSECKFYDDNPEKEIYHCNDCGVCRLGRSDQFFHCKGCNVCISVDLKNKHRCISDCIASDCPVCVTSLADSSQPTSLMPCGHAMHTSCLETYRKTNYRCPTCQKSLGDVATIFKEIDRVMATMQVPEKYKKMQATISCRDCEQRSVVPHHFMYHKCTHCSSYNTSVLETTRI